MRYYSLYLVGICVIVFALQNIFPAITDNFSLVSARALSEPWMFFTAIFLHADIMHLLYNMFALALFGSMLEKIVGGRNFLAIFIISGLIASAAAFFFYGASLGASGAIFGILGALAVLRPRMTIWLYVPMPMFVAIFVWAALDLTGFLYPSGIANAAHLAGLGAGLLFGLALRKKFGERAPKRRQYEIGSEEFRRWEDEWVK
ncbi:MAG: rhomboid family intramembrane serine protease [Candidatus Aenigmatarchaeota archaeon]